MNQDHGRTLPVDPDDRASTGQSRRLNLAENFLFLVGFSYTFCCVENPDDIDPWWTICGTFAELDTAGVYHFSNASTNADPAHAAPQYVQNGSFWLLTHGRDRIMNPSFGSRCLLVKAEPVVRVPHSLEVENTVGRIVPFRSRRRYALADAVRTSDFDGAKAALERGEDLRIPSDVSGLTAAFMAAHRGDSGILSLLLDHGLGIDDPVDGICVRATEQDTFLVDGVVVTESDGYLGGKERALLHIAAAKGHLRVIEMLVQRGANIERTFRGESTPLLTAAKYHQSAAVELLLRCGADVHFMRRIDGGTSLHMAASNGNRRIIKALLGAGANVCHEDIRGYNAAHFAVTRGRGFETVELLLDAGDANIHHVRPLDGLTLLLDAASGGQTATVLMLLQRGASVNQTCNGGESALFMASDKGCIDVVKVLLDHGANINLCDVYGCTPLLNAVMRVQREVVKVLLERNADVNFANRFGKTPLEEASSGGFFLNPNIDLGIFHALLERGANIDLLRDPFSLGFERFAVFERFHDGVADCVRHCLEFIAEVRFQAAEEPNFAHKLIRDVVELGCFPAPLAQWVPILHPKARAELKAWSSHALNAERMCFAGFFDETADAETSRQSEVEGPVAEELASMSVYPLAATRRLLREVEFFFAHGKIASSNTLSTAPSSDSDTALTPEPTESWQAKMKRWKAV